MPEFTTDTGETRDVPPVEERMEPCQFCGDDVFMGLLEDHEAVCTENPANQ
ncbi:hypothetical protein [Halorarum salinum]|uniref:Uncharacterized protein n=1 Tax=Halorarum salinum TaxID=2743089 RepID=A0A7D5QBU1_9EURY|nr:hypothetical protein [Halobaculum salinum]QLG62818.1 hypothetical protein HUG12_14215 [Halobaculum salinum]